MGQLQHRGGKFGKIVLKHHPIDGLVEALAVIEQLSEVKTILPGVITSVRGRPIARQRGGLQLKLQYIAPDRHIRLLARYENTTQEIRVVSSNLTKTFSDLSRLLD